ncbi:MAG: potassium transporter TrkA [Nitrospirae bacterium GWC2_46_6]|nr:MAG: potassium transporter TrkA [Nitrospirae bacterium GWA2_46_11]OGW22215.1 MAG: potassium transporter TrkA [Nitrospirae bacterium GWC2_46_6]OGW23006.1 MAG: potassium transporter TrkA [Nitrospirae bacterium GWB2_47_37]HAK88348.1 potassium transporter TrkA [Nitrospiraceae bacterium]HCL81408.1 potassium transporter TrkA [Nitrospiraceae bacterium]
MADNLISEIYKKFFWIGIALLDILLIGTIGYWFVGEGKYSMLDCLYMTVITIATIGYGEIVDMSNKPAGRIFTMILSFSGIGILTYILSSLTAFVVEGDLNETFRRRKMEKMIKKFKDHYIVCGIEGVGFHILSELHETQRPHVIIDLDRKKIERVLETFKDLVFIQGDATDNDTLLKAGIMEATGLFAVSGDDNQNLVISLTAKQLNPNIRVVARCHDLKNIEKMKKAGADAVVSPTFIGGLRMASEMVRPAVVSFLDTMLRDKQKNLRIEEAPVPASFAGKSIADLNLKKYPGVLLMAVKTKDDWAYNPPDGYILKTENTLIFMTTPEERFTLEKVFSS